MKERRGRDDRRRQRARSFRCSAAETWARLNARERARASERWPEQLLDLPEEARSRSAFVFVRRSNSPRAGASWSRFGSGCVLTAVPHATALPTFGVVPVERTAGSRGLVTATEPLARRRESERRAKRHHSKGSRATTSPQSGNESDERELAMARQARRRRPPTSRSAPGRSCERAVEQCSHASSPDLARLSSDADAQRRTTDVRMEKSV